MFHFVVLIMICILYITQGIIKNDVISIFFIISSILAFQQSNSKLPFKNKVFTLVLIISGILIHIIYGNRGLNVFDGLTQNLPLLAIILLAPLISLPLKGEGILNTVVKNLNKYKNNDRKIFYGVSSFMLVLAPIINMGAIRIIDGFIEELKIENKLLSKAYYGGFTPAIIWSPFFASVGIVLSMAKISYISYMPVGLFFAFIQFMIALLVMKPPKVLKEKSVVNEKKNFINKDYLLLILFILFLISLLIIMELITKLPILLLVSISCIIVPTIWTIIRRKWKWMKIQIKDFKNQMVSNTNLEVSLFLSAGLFGNSLMNTPIVSSLKSAIEWSAQGSVLIIFIFVVSFITIVAFLGIHQIISVPVIFPLLLTSEIGLNVYTAAFMCIYSWMLSSSISPLNALNIIISQCVKVNGLRVAFKWNGKFFIISFMFASVYVLFLNQF